MVWRWFRLALTKSATFAKSIMVLMSLLHSMKVKRRFFPTDIYKKIVTSQVIDSLWQSQNAVAPKYMSVLILPKIDMIFDIWAQMLMQGVNGSITKLTRYYSHRSTDVRKLLPCEAFDQASNEGAFAHFWRSHHHYNNRRGFQGGPVYQRNVMFLCFNILSPTKQC